MPQSLPLNTSTWDLELDSNGNWNLTDEPASIAQDVASAIRTFAGECWYNTNLGMPYFQSILWQLPPGSLVVSFIVAQAMTIDLVTKCTVVSLQLINRKLTGTVVIQTSNSSNNLVVGF
jgi:hypothetical protein